MYSNTLESIKIIDEVIIPYVSAQHEILSNPNQAVLLTFDVFHGQISDNITSHLLQINIYTFSFYINNQEYKQSPRKSLIC